MYEIPQQLEYKEKIVFGLTFSQLFYALIFSPFILGILTKLQAGITTKITLALIPTLLAIAFMFFDLTSNLKKGYTWAKTRNLDTPKKLEKALALGKIKNNLIYEKNKRIAVIKVESINFSMKTSKEKEIISYAFQKFLNSIDFPIQILMTTKTLNLDSYLNILENKMINKNYSEIFNSYKNHMKSLVQDNSAMNRNFYLIIPETSNIDIQIKLCEERLNSLNLKTSRLKDTKLKKFSRFLKYRGENDERQNSRGKKE